MAIINGRRIQVPPSGITGRNLIQQLNPAQGRRSDIQQGTVFRPIQSDYTYTQTELFDKHGNPVKITTIPDRTKGMVTYGGNRTFLSKQIITEQVYDVAEKLFKKGVSFDEEHADWMIANQYALPPIWHHIARTTNLLIIFPTEYPELPPVDFYLREDIPLSGACVENLEARNVKEHRGCRNRDEALPSYPHWFAITRKQFDSSEPQFFVQGFGSMPIGSVCMQTNPFDSSFSHQEKALSEHSLSKATSFVRGRDHHIIDDTRVLSYPSLRDGDWLPVMPDNNQECRVRGNNLKEFLVIFLIWHR